MCKFWTRVWDTAQCQKRVCKFDPLRLEPRTAGDMEVVGPVAVPWPLERQRRVRASTGTACILETTVDMETASTSWDLKVVTPHFLTEASPTP
mmetsp:Transcript_14431/g.39445  ORF Transcript_14431/g.39445 Transcript_14431/m.39445 type:complete len:93 (+) Transcript_14431:1076-1354(+)